MKYKRKEVIGDCRLILGDCLEAMMAIPDGSVDLVLTDPPYGTTACKWDAVIPFEPMWEQYWRIVKSNAAIVLTSAQPFTSAVVMSQVQHFKYEWIWEKNRPTNFAQAKNQPMRKHESVLVFSQGVAIHASQSTRRMPYNPQGLEDIDPYVIEKKKSEKTDAFFSDRPSHGKFIREKTGYPHSILKYSTDQLGLHPTAKPVALMEYLIKTYTNEGETVLDNCMGSGTTGVACKNLNRKFIGIEKDDRYFEIACKRINDHIPKQEALL